MAWPSPALSVCRLPSVRHADAGAVTVMGALLSMSLLGVLSATLVVVRREPDHTASTE
jgi:hypothetical protein